MPAPPGAGLLRVLSSAAMKQPKLKWECRGRAATAIALSLVLIVIACAGCAVPEPGASGPSSSKAVTIELRRAETAPGEGLVEAVSGVETLYLHPSAELSNGDIAKARPTLASTGDQAIAISFTPEGAEKITPSPRPTWASRSRSWPTAVSWWPP